MVLQFEKNWCIPVFSSFNYLALRNVKSMSNIIPVTTDDERDPREDQAELDRREAEIKGDRPPHHEG